MATIAYMTAKGQKQGDIKGSVTEKGREGTIALLAVAYEIDTPFDPSAGLPSGRRQHKPVAITKALDPATPKLLEALITNEILTSVQIDFWRVSLDGREERYFSIALTNVRLCDAKGLTSETTPAQELDEYAFLYQKIEWTWVQGGVTAQDSWSAAV